MGTEIIWNWDTQLPSDDTTVNTWVATPTGPSSMGSHPVLLPRKLGQSKHSTHGSSAIRHKSLADLLALVRVSILYDKMYEPW